MIPLFFYSIAFLLGISSHLCFTPIYVLLLLLVLYQSRLFLTLLVYTAGWIFALYTVTLPALPEEGFVGKGTFIPDSIAHNHSPFGTSLMTRGVLKTFGPWENIPCHIYNTQIDGNHALYVEGCLLQKKTPHYLLKIVNITPDPDTSSLARWRFQVKDWVRHQCSSFFPKKETAAFLLSMMTGETDDRLLTLQFNRLGLLHLLGVSGFQFSLLALLLGALFKKIFKTPVAAYLQIILLTGYTFILGNSPPIQRAWFTLMLYTLAQLYRLQITPLNALGGALIWVLLLDPCVIFQLGFQFSFLCTAAIFTLYPILQTLIRTYLPDRPFSQIKALPLLDRCGHFLTFFCKEAVCLNVAIHLISLPLILYHFHKFPLLSLAYNLFLPLFASIAYLSLILGLLPLAGWVTDMMIAIVTHPPTLFDAQWRVPNLSLEWTVLLLALFFVVVIRSKSISRPLSQLFSKIEKKERCRIFFAKNLRSR